MNLEGSMVALVTPFLENRQVDYKTLEKLLLWHIDMGTQGVIPCGTTGESTTLSPEEQEKIIALSVKVVKDKVPIIAGTSSNDTRLAVQYTKKAKNLGASACLCVTPSYSLPTQEGIKAHFMEVAQVGLPVVLYNNPKRTACKIELETLEELSLHPQIIAIKEASGDPTKALKIQSICNLKVLSGDDALLLPFLSLGAKGIISVVANIIPYQWSEIIHLYTSGEGEKAQALMQKYLPLCEAAFLENSPSSIKYMMQCLNLCHDYTRLPLVPISSKTKKKIQKTLKLSCLKTLEQTCLL